jgi:hypothetical protein
MRSPRARSAWLAVILAAPACNALFGISEGVLESTGGSATASSAIGGSVTASSAIGGSVTSQDSGPDTSAPGAVTLDPGFPKVAIISGTGGDAGAPALSATFDVPSGGRMVVAVVVWGQYGGAGVWPVTVAGGGLSWTGAVGAVSLASFKDAVGVGIWTAWVSAATPGVTLTATRSNAVPADAVLVVYSLGGASPTPGPTGTTNGFASAAPLSVSLPSVAAGSFVAFGLLDGNGMNGVRGNTLPTTTYDAMLASGSGNGIAVGHLTTPPAVAGPLVVGQAQTVVQYDVGAAVAIVPP